MRVDKVLQLDSEREADQKEGHNHHDRRQQESRERRNGLRDPGTEAVKPLEPIFEPDVPRIGENAENQRPKQRRNEWNQANADDDEQPKEQGVQHDGSGENFAHGYSCYSR